MKKLLSVLLALVILSSFAIAPAFAEEPVTIRIYNWGDANDMAADAAAVARFNEKYPNVTVDIQYKEKSITWADYITQLLAQIAAGDAPDMCLMAIEGLYQLVSYGVMMPLNGYIEGDETASEVLSDVHQSLIDGLTIDGEVYFFPCHWNGMILFCNKTMFEEAGLELPDGNWNWEQFLDVCQKLTKGEGATKQFAFDFTPAAIFLNLFTYSNGCSTLGADLNTSNLLDPKVVESYQFINDLIWKYGVMPIPQAGADCTMNLINGMCAMSITGHTAVGTYAANGFEDLYVTYFPKNDAENGTHIFGADGYGILNSSKNPDLCWELIKEFDSQESQDHVAKMGVSNPARRSSANTPEALAYPENAQVFYNILDQGCKILPAPYASAEYENLLTRYYMEMMSQPCDVTEYLARADEELTQMFAEQ